MAKWKWMMIGMMTHMVVVVDDIASSFATVVTVSIQSLHL